MPKRSYRDFKGTHGDFVGDSWRFHGDLLEPTGCTCGSLHEVDDKARRNPWRSQSDPREPSRLPEGPCFLIVYPLGAQGQFPINIIIGTHAIFSWNPTVLTRQIKSLKQIILLTIFTESLIMKLMAYALQRIRELGGCAVPPGRYVAQPTKGASRSLRPASTKEHP